ncbi:hypothetical protein L6278_00425, partial [Candidatus Parcubacteria bacterium]|nr:hypothetical protein [Candidatus Parcubacteria bacterium]
MPKKRDYHDSEYAGNLLKQREQLIQQEKKSWRKKMFFLLIVLVFLGIIYWIFFSSWWQIKKINITGTSQVEEIEQIEKIAQEFLWHRRWLIFSGQNSWLVNKPGLQNLILTKLDLDKAEIEIQKPDLLKIKINKKTPSLIWQEDDKYFTIFNDAKIKEQVFDISVYELPIVGRNTTTDIEIGKQYVSDEQLNYISKIFSLFTFYFSDFKIHKFIVVDMQSREVKLITSENWYILLNLDTDEDQSLSNIKA